MTDTPTLTQAEELGVLVGAAYGKALAERDQAVALLRSLAERFPSTSFAHANSVLDEAKAWLEEFDRAEAVGSPETPEQETPGP